MADVVRAVKAKSTHWLHHQFPDLAEFGWQVGYGAFTVSQSQVETVRSYIARQEEHHRNKPFRDEFIALLMAHDIPFTEEELCD